MGARLPMTDARIRAEADARTRALMRAEAFLDLTPRKRVVAAGKYAGREISDIAQDARGLTFLLDADRKWVVNPPVLVPDPAGAIVRTGNVRGVDGIRREVTFRYRYDPEAALRDVVEGMGSTTVVFADTADTWLEESAAAYADARAGASPSLHSAADATWEFGQAFFTPTYYCSEAFIPFDTSGLPDTDTIDDAVLSIYGQSNGTTTDFTILAGLLDFAIPVVTGAWQDGTELAALTPLASFATSGFSIAAYNDLTNTGAGIKSIVSKTGTTKIILWSDRMEAGTTPTNGEFVDCHAADATGTTNDPKLTVTHTAAASGSAGPGALIGAGFFPG